MTNKIEEVRKAYREKVLEANKRNQEDKVLLNLHKLNEAQKKSIEALASIDDLSGGQLDSLVGIYKTIKSSSSKDK